MNIRYKKPDMSVWQGRTDHTSDSDFFRFHQAVQAFDLNGALPKLSEKDICLLGFACDEGVKRNMGRPGAAEGPLYIRKGLASLPWHWDGVSLYDAGDIICVDGGLEAAEKALAEAVYKIRSAGAFPVVLGGGHEVALGHYRGLKKFHKKQSLGIINFDAHFDMRSAEKMSSGTMFSQIADTERDFRYFCIGIQKNGNTKALFNKAGELGAEYMTAEDAEQGGGLNKLHAFMDRSDRIYMTLCFDVISSACAPGVSAPQPFGLDPRDVRMLMADIFRTGKVTGFDIAEVAPGLDTDDRTSKLAALFIFHLIDVLSN